MNTLLYKKRSLQFIITLLVGSSLVVSYVIPALHVEAATYTAVNLGSGLENGQSISNTNFITGNTTVIASSTRFNRAFLKENTGTMTILGTFGGNYAYGEDINDQGTITGDAFLASGSRHAFIKATQSDMQDLGTLGGANSLGHGINLSGVVVGTSETTLTGTKKPHAFKWERGVMTDLGVLIKNNPSFDYSEAMATNDQGQVAGFSFKNAR